MWSSNSIHACVSEENENTDSNRNMHPSVHSSIFSTAMIWKQLKCLSIDKWIKKRHYTAIIEYSVQFSSVVQSCPTLCNSMNRSMPGLPVHHQLPEFTQTHVHRVSDAIQSFHPLSSPSLPALNPSQHQDPSFPMSQLFP